MQFFFIINDSYLVGSMDKDVIIIFLFILFTIIVPLMMHISLTIYEDDKIKKKDQLKWDDWG